MEHKNARSKFWLTHNAEERWQDFLLVPVWMESEGWPLLKVTLHDFILSAGIQHNGNPEPILSSQAELSMVWRKICKVSKSFHMTVTGIRTEFLELHPPFSRRFDALCARWINIFHKVDSRKRDVVLAVKRRRPADMTLIIQEVAKVWYPAANSWNDLFARAFPRKGWEEYKVAYNFLPSLSRTVHSLPYDLVDFLPRLNPELTGLLSHWYQAAFVQKWTYHGRPDNELELQRAGPALLLAKGVALIEMAHIVRKGSNPKESKINFFEYEERVTMIEALQHIKEIYGFCTYHGLHPIEANQFPWNHTVDFTDTVKMMKIPVEEFFYQLLETPSVEGSDKESVDSMLTVRWNLIWRMECLDIWILRTRLLLDMPPHYGALKRCYLQKWTELYSWFVSLTERVMQILASEEEIINRMMKPEPPLDPRQTLVRAITKAIECSGLRWNYIADPITGLLEGIRKFRDSFPLTLDLATNPEAVFIDDDKIIFGNPSSISGHPVLPIEPMHNNRNPTNRSAKEWSLATTARTPWSLVRHSFAMDFSPLGPLQRTPILAHISCLIQVSGPMGRQITLTSNLLAQDLVISIHKYGNRADKGPDQKMNDYDHATWDRYLPVDFRSRKREAKGEVKEVKEFDLFPRFPRPCDLPPIYGNEIFDEDLEEL